MALTKEHSSTLIQLSRYVLDVGDGGFRGIPGAFENNWLCIARGALAHNSGGTVDAGNLTRSNIAYTPALTIFWGS